MTRFSTLLAVAIFVVGTIVSRPAIAQYPPASYTPQTPVISPWMGLWQRNTGPLDNYHNSVLPQLELDAALQSQNAALNRQGARLQNLNSQFVQSQESPSGIGPTGQGATFMNYSHFYGGNRAMSHTGPARPAPSRASSNLPAFPGAR